MVDAKADWLYHLPQWDALILEERRKELYKEQKPSKTVVKGLKIGRNDPAPVEAEKYKNAAAAICKSKSYMGGRQRTKGPVYAMLSVIKRSENANNTP